MKILIFLITFIIVNLSLFSQTNLNKKDENLNSGWWHISDTLKLSNFIAALRLNGPADSLHTILEIDDNFPSKFVKRSNISTLITSIKSTERCKCTLNPLSSYIPLHSDSAQLGGYILALIKSYKNRTRFRVGLHFCPKADMREADSLMVWWSKETNLNNH